MTDSAKQCSVLFVNPGAQSTALRAALQALGFLVTEADDWPEDHRAALHYHVVILRIRQIRDAPMIAARLRAKPHFGQRVLIGLVDGPATRQQRLAACTSGFDDVLADTCEGDQLAAAVLKRLRSRPEYQCYLPTDRRHSAA